MTLFSNPLRSPFPVVVLRAVTFGGALLVVWVVALAVYGRVGGQPALVFSVTEFGPWKNLTRAIWVGLSIALGARILLSGFSRFRLRSDDLPHLLSGMLLIGTLLLFNAQVAEDSQGIAEASRSQARALGKQLLTTIDDPTLSLDRMAERWSFRRGIPEREWRGDVSQMLAHFPGLFIYARIDPAGVIRWVYPESNAESYLGRSVFDGPGHGTTFLLAKTTRSLAFSKVMRLRTGRIGFGALAPIWEGETFNGALSFGIRLEDFLKPAIDPGEYRVVFAEGGHAFYAMNDAEALPAKDPQQMRRWRGEDAVDFRNLRWTVEVFPLNAVIARRASPLPVVVLSVGLLLSMLCAALVDLTLSARRARAQARDALNWQEAIVNGSDLAIISTDATGIVKSFNPAAERLLGYRADEVCGLVTPNLWHEPTEVVARADELSTAADRVIVPGFDTLVEGAREGAVERREWTFIRKEGARRSVATSVHPLAENERNPGGFVWMVEDLTLKKNQAAKIAEQQALMLHSSKLASLGEMAAGVAHEINNPLLVIAGKVEQVKRQHEQGSADAATILKHMDSIRSTVDRIAKIVSGLRSFARESGGEPFAVASVREIVDETVALCAERFRNHAIELEIPPIDDLEVRCRPYQIAQVLLNLLSNAFDAANGGLSERRWVRLEVKRTRGTVEIVVSDSGDGVLPALREKIMMPFFTTKEVGKGTGLGLSISQGIMADHSGSLDLEADADFTRFVARLPIGSPPA